MDVCHLCKRCHKHPVKPGRVSCIQCLAVWAARAAYRKQMGLCRCGEPPEQGYKRCQRCRESANLRHHERQKADPHYRIARALRSRLSVALRAWRAVKRVSAIRDAGCDVPQLAAWLESKWSPSMSWDNYGLWEIDHVIPLASFDLSDPEAVKAACHYTNLQPLWSADNKVKGCNHV